MLSPPGQPLREQVPLRIALEDLRRSSDPRSRRSRTSTSWWASSASASGMRQRRGLPGTLQRAGEHHGWLRRIGMAAVDQAVQHGAQQAGLLAASLGELDVGASRCGDRAPTTRSRRGERAGRELDQDVTRHETLGDTGARMPRSILWFRRDLRLAEHLALAAAHAAGDVVPLFVVDPLFAARSGAPRRVVHGAGTRRSERADRTAPLVYRHGDPVDVVPALAAEVGADTVFVSRDYGPYGRRRDAAVASGCGPTVGSCAASGSPVRGRPRLGDQGRRHALRRVHPVLEAWSASARRHGSSARRRPHRRRRRGSARPMSRATVRPTRSAVRRCSAAARAGVGRASRSGARSSRTASTDYDDRRDLPAVDGHQPDVACAAVGPRAPASSCSTTSATRRPTHVFRTRAGLARVLRRRAVPPAGDGVAEPPAEDGRDAGRHRRRRHVGAVRALGRRDAPATRSSTPGCVSCWRTGLDAQPGAHDRRQLPGEGPPPAVAVGCPPLHAAPGRRRPGLEQPRLAVGGRHRHRRCAVLPGLQPDRTGRAVRPRRRLRPRAGCPSWPASTERRGPRARAAARPAGYPAPMVDHAAERDEALARYRR